MEPDQIADTDRFVPDHDLVIHLANWLMDDPKGKAFMATAYDALVFLYEECGVDVPEHSDGNVEPTRCSFWRSANRCAYPHAHEGPHSWESAQIDGGGSGE